MAIVVYQCDTCLRTIERTRNENGLDVFGRCVITEGCKGELFQLEVLRKIKPNIPDSVKGLRDWERRKIMYEHTQDVRSNEWTITHNLKGNPTISVYVSPQSDTYVDPSNVEPITPETEEYIDENTKKITLSENDGYRIGVAQAILRSSSSRPVVEPADIVPSIALQIGNVESIPLAVKVGKLGTTAPASISLGITFVDNDTGALTPSVEALTSTPRDDQGALIVGTSWSNSSDILVKSTSNYSKLFWLNVPAQYRSARYSFFITSVNGSPLVADSIYLLLSQTPNENGDEIVDSIVDMIKVNEQNSKVIVTLGAEKIKVTESVFEVVYPPIRTL